MSTATTASVSTHILDTSVGRPAEGVAVQLSARTGRHEEWRVLGSSRTDGDGRCRDLPAPPEGAVHLRLVFDVEPYLTADARQRNPIDDPTRQAEEQRDVPRAGDSDAFFPEVTIVFAADPGEHYHVPLLLNPFGYSVYRGS